MKPLISIFHPLKLIAGLCSRANNFGAKRETRTTKGPNALGNGSRGCASNQRKIAERVGLLAACVKSLMLRPFNRPSVRRAGNTLNRRDEYSLRRRLLARVLEERK